MAKNISLFVISLFFYHIVLAQGDKRTFSFPDTDHALLAFWLNDNVGEKETQALFTYLSDKWSLTRDEIASMNIAHLDISGFILDQDIRIASIKESLSESRYKEARHEAYILLNEFRCIRECFTDDEYTLDYVLASYEDYLRVHEIVHDEMMGLYEWREFVWFVDQLKCKVDLLDEHITNDQVEGRANKSIEALGKVKVCLAALDDSLGTAYQADFVMPCDDLGQSFIDLFRAYSQYLTI